MAAVSLNSGPYLQVGPRQGVYCSPVRWRATQFRSPEETYRFRARIEPPLLGSGFPARIMRRQFSTASNRSNSSSSLAASRSRTDVLTGPKHRWPQIAGSKQTAEDPQKSNGGPKFTLTAQAIVMQPRPPQRPPVVPRSTITTARQTFSYPDPTKMKGDPAFDIRLLELGNLQRDTIKYEELKSRLSGRNHSAGLQSRPSSSTQSRPSSSTQSRPSSSCSLRSASSRTATHRVSLATPTERRLHPSPLLSRKTSLPATLGYSSRPTSAGSCCRTPTPLTAEQRNSKPILNCTQSNSPTEASKRLHGRLSDVEESDIETEKFIHTAIRNHSSPKPDLETANFVTDLPHHEMSQPSNTATNLTPVQSSQTAGTKGDLEDSGPNPNWGVTVAFVGEEGPSPEILVTDSEQCKAEEGRCVDEGDLRVTSVLELSSDSLYHSQEQGSDSKRRGGSTVDCKGANSNVEIGKKTGSNFQGSHSTTKLESSNSCTSIDSTSVCSLKSSKAKKSTKVRGHRRGQKSGTRKQKSWKVNHSS